MVEELQDAKFELARKGALLINNLHPVFDNSGAKLLHIFIDVFENWILFVSLFVPYIFYRFYYYFHFQCIEHLPHMAQYLIKKLAAFCDPEDEESYDECGKIFIFVE